MVLGFRIRLAFNGGSKMNLIEQLECDIVKCWSCGNNMTYIQRSENDGFCIHCNAEIILDDH